MVGMASSPTAAGVDTPAMARSAGVMSNSCWSRVWCFRMAPGPRAIPSADANGGGGGGCSAASCAVEAEAAVVAETETEAEAERVAAGMEAAAAFEDVASSVVCGCLFATASAA
jgi:hypothetical protein